ncbi:hypothetical protein [Streptomyces sp. NPDC051561]|uniref:hypothetical protein n=1 Tax=Streptomyces sp. NPDC051561 TaxID=3365658 RepID=UPI00378C8408
MTSGMRITWSLAGPGWADCTLEDPQAKVELTASYITSAPEEFLTAVARLVAGETETRAQFEAEPTAYRWIFYRDRGKWGEHFPRTELESLRRRLYPLAPHTPQHTQLTELGGRDRTRDTRRLHPLQEFFRLLDQFRSQEPSSE